MRISGYDHSEVSESTARRYLLGFCYKNHQRFCPKCRNRAFYRMADGRRRCRRCRYTFHDFSGRWIDTGNLSCVQWLKIIHSFCQELSARETAARLGIAYDTVHKAITTIRLAIAAHGESAAILSCDDTDVYSGYRGEEREEVPSSGSGGSPPVFGLRERGGRAFVQVLANLRFEKVITSSLRKARWKNIIYTDPHDGFDSLILCPGRYMSAGHHALFSKVPLLVVGTGGFWEYVKERVTRYRSISPQRFPLYLREFEFRYNHREEDIFPVLVRFICDFKPSER